MRQLVLSIILAGVFGPGVLAQYDQYDFLRKYIENPSMVQEYQEPPHVPYVPFETVQQAVEGDWEKSPFHLSLDGTWKFYWSKSPMTSPEYFYMNEYDPSDWNEIQVPGTWQMQGYDYYIYRNVPMEFSPYDPPNVPLEFNPTGCYIREFDIPAGLGKPKDIPSF